MFRRIRFVVPVLLLFAVCAGGQETTRPIRVAILSLGDSSTAKLTSAKLSATLKQERQFDLIDPDQAKAAAAGAGYSGSLNLSVAEARDLGAAMGTDFFIAGDAQTLRRSPSSGQIYFDSYATIFLVSTRTGRLVSWWRPSIRQSQAQAAEQALLAELASNETAKQIGAAILAALNAERNERAQTVETQAPLIESAPDDEKKAEADGLRLPRPFRRLIPPYPESAAEAEVEATVDVLADIDEKGDVKRVEVARWAGFGLDESTVSTVQRINFFPAMRNGVAVPLRVLLRYNFRKPPRSNH